MKTSAALTALTALANKSRLAIFRLLVRAGFGGIAAGQIAEALDIPNPTLSFHLKELTHAGLISSRQESRHIFYIANYNAMSELMGYLSEHCCNGNPELCLPAEECCEPTVSSPKRKKR